jgi:hypothetical protein
MDEGKVENDLCHSGKNEKSYILKNSMTHTKLTKYNKSLYDAMTTLQKSERDG